MLEQTLTLLDVRSVFTERSQSLRGEEEINAALRSHLHHSSFMDSDISSTTRKEKLSIDVKLTSGQKQEKAWIHMCSRGSALSPTRCFLAQTLWCVKTLNPNRPDLRFQPIDENRHRRPKGSGSVGSTAGPRPPAVTLGSLCSLLSSGR